MTPVILFACVSAVCACCAYMARGADRMHLVSAALGWAGLAVLAYHVS